MQSSKKKKSLTEAVLVQKVMLVSERQDLSSCHTREMGQ